MLVAAIGIDMLSVVIGGSFAGSEQLLLVVEDGGELLAITWAVAVAAGVSLLRPAAFPLGQPAR